MSIPLTKREFALAAAITCFVVAVFAVVFGYVTRDLDQTRPRNDDPHLLQAAKATGDLIIARLEDHKQQVGAYPTTLEQLAAWDAQPIPPCPAGMQRWEYLFWEELEAFR
ncbi:MAG: hypothetical protein AAFY46_14205, partial [Planctomycetota bacterium]